MFFRIKGDNIPEEILGSFVDMYREKFHDNYDCTKSVDRYSECGYGISDGEVVEISENIKTWFAEYVNDNLNLNSSLAKSLFVDFHKNCRDKPIEHKGTIYFLNNCPFGIVVC